MKHQFLVALALPLLITSVASQANTISDGSPVAPAGAPKSFFVSDPFETGFAKDPFFPKTERFQKKKAEIEENPTPKSKIPDNISLRGLSSSDGKKLAIINNYTLGEGEEFTLKGTDGKPVKIKCVTIKEKSVLVSSQDETREIALRAALQ